MLLKTGVMKLLKKNSADKVFTWDQYDQIKAEKGAEAANKAQADA